MEIEPKIRSIYPYHKTNNEIYELAKIILTTIEYYNFDLEDYLENSNFYQEAQDHIEQLEEQLDIANNSQYFKIKIFSEFFKKYYSKKVLYELIESSNHPSRLERHIRHFDDIEIAFDNW